MEIPPKEPVRTFADKIREFFTKDDLELIQLPPEPTEAKFVTSFGHVWYTYPECRKLSAHSDADTKIERKLASLFSGWQMKQELQK